MERDMDAREISIVTHTYIFKDRENTNNSFDVFNFTKIATQSRTN